MKLAEADGLGVEWGESRESRGIWSRLSANKKEIIKSVVLKGAYSGAFAMVAQGPSAILNKYLYNSMST